MKNTTARVCLLFFIATLQLAATRQQLPNIYAGNHANQLNDTHSFTKRLTQKQFARSGITSLSEGLYSLAGLQYHNTSGTSTSSSFSMRGFGDNATSNVLMLINGIPLTNPDLMPPDFDTIPIEDIREVEIIAGSESVLYGDQAVAGTINILTANEQEKAVRFQCLAGSYRLKSCRVGASSYWGNLIYHVSASQHVSDNYREHNETLNNTLFTTAGYASDSQKLDVVYKFTYENMQYPGALDARQVRQNRRQSTNSRDFFRDKNQFIDIKYSYTTNPNLKWQTSGAVRYMDGNGYLSSDFTQSRHSILIQPAMFVTYEALKLQLGVNGEFDQYRLSSSFGLTDNQQQKVSGFGLLNYALNTKTAFSIGARLSQQFTRLRTSATTTTLNRAFASNIGFSYTPSDNITLFARRADNYRFPKAEENSSSSLPLRTQRGTSYETGVSYDHNEDVIALTVFELNLRDEIAFDPLQTPENPFGTNRNLAPTKRTGFSVSGKKQLWHKFAIDTQINYAHARFESGIKAGKHIPLVSDVIARLGIEVKLTPNWRFYTESIFTSRQYPANDDLNVTGGVGGYTVYNANLRYQKNAFSAALRLNNIFNKYYYLYSIYQTGIQKEFFYPAADRNAVLVLSYRLD